MLAARQYADWRELRFEPYTSPPARRAMAQLATRMRDTFWRPPAAAPARALEPGRMAGPPGREAEPADTGKTTAKNEPPTHVVDPFHRGDFTTISAAISAARPGDRILVRPGLYQEGLVIDKPLEIIGDGPAADITIQVSGAHALQFQANIGRVANLTLRQVGGEGNWYGADITQGRLELEGCDITSKAGSCVAIRNGADPRLRRNTIHDGKQSGVQVRDGGLGTLEDNDITANAFAGVAISAAGNPTLRRNTIHDGKQSGVRVRDGGLGSLEDNDITANAFAGITIATGGNPTLRRNRINRNKSHAVAIQKGGKGVFEDNDLTGNVLGAWKIEPGTVGNVTRARNRPDDRR
jgi:F-box protein 11